MSSLSRRFKSLFRRKRRKSAHLKAQIPELTHADETLITSVDDYTMTNAVRRHALLKALRYVNERRLPGDFVECGVWRGGNIFLGKLVQDREFPNIHRDFWLYDTFEGMTQPGDFDVSPNGVNALSEFQRLTKAGEGWCLATREDVEANAISMLGSKDGLRFVQGPVEQTLQHGEHLPAEIAILRLDTDWYESTRAELEILYPRLVSRGVLIIDDYGVWQGAKRAVDEYFAGQAVFLHRVDHSCRIIVKD
jgi:hypothetical protein